MASDTLHRSSRVRALVLTGYGVNCEAETRAGLDRAGAISSLIHVSDVLHRGGSDLKDFQILAFVGGFSFGDHVAGGRIFANRLRYRLGDRLARFVDDGGLIIGICNGFQTIIKLGLLPALDRGAGSGLAVQSATLVHNDHLGYRDAWVRLIADPASPCVFTRGMTSLECPSRHGEGKLVASSETWARLSSDHCIPLRFVGADGQPTQSWPENPNGSPGGAAALCDSTGRVFGVMPHPEAYLYPENHPRWRAQLAAGRLPEVGAGLAIFENAVRAVSA